MDNIENAYKKIEEFIKFISEYFASEEITEATLTQSLTSQYTGLLVVNLTKSYATKNKLPLPPIQVLQSSENILTIVKKAKEDMTNKELYDSLENTNKEFATQTIKTLKNALPEQNLDIIDEFVTNKGLR
jgi:hypothetical protein